MRFFIITFLFLPLSLFSQDNRFSLYLANKNEGGFIVDNSLNLTDQIFYLHKTDSTLKLYSNALIIECSENISDVYFDNVLIGKYPVKVWKDPHYYIIHFTQTDSFYFFYEIFSFMNR